MPLSRENRLEAMQLRSFSLFGPKNNEEPTNAGLPPTKGISTTFGIQWSHSA
jgi:hypothetical protein